MEIKKLLEIYENLVKEDKGKVARLKRLMEDIPLSDSAAMLASLIENEPSHIQTKLLKVLENKRIWEKNQQDNIQDIKIGQTGNSFDKFLKPSNKPNVSRPSKGTGFKQNNVDNKNRPENNTERKRKMR